MTTGAAASPSTALTSEALSAVPRRPEISKTGITSRRLPRAATFIHGLFVAPFVTTRVEQLTLNAKNINDINNLEAPHGGIHKPFHSKDLHVPTLEISLAVSQGATANVPT